MPVLENNFKRNPTLRSQYELQNQNIRIAALQRKALSQQLRIEGTTYYIPIVFHIVLTNPNLVTDAMVQAQVDQLNRDYGGVNPDSTLIPSWFKPLFAKTSIQFKLAQRTPDDNPSTGIERITTSKSSFAITDPSVKYTSSGGANAWDHTKYFNVWITDLSQGYLGYATFPNSGPAAEDGVVIKYTSLPGGTAPYNKGRTLVHESGHFFSLIHIWGDENGCSGTDEIDDTPNQGTYTSGCPTSSGGPRTDACTTTSPGIMYENYMDYTDDACMVMFTLDQKARMESALNVYRASLITSNGADPVVSFNLDAAAKSINTPLQRICSATFQPVITLRNRGAQTLTAVTIKASIDNGTAITTNWTGSLASLTETNVTLNSMTVTVEGIHVLNVDISSANGTTDDNTSNDAINITFLYYLPYSPPITESFESTTYPPIAWDIVNPDLGVTWERTATAAKTGNASVVLRNYDYSANGQKDYLRLPLMNITNADSAFMTFQVAAAVVTDPKTSAAFDTLDVLVSKDCGATFTSLYHKGGADLITRSAATVTSFTPASTEWRKDSVNLTPYIGAGQILVAFMNTNQHENNIYLDDINVYSVSINTNLKAKGFMITPNPTNGKIAVQFYPNAGYVKGINIFSSTGERVASRIINAAGSSYYGFDLSAYASGVYVVQVVLGDKVITQKVIKR
ncbi:hypothetical protein A3860_32045 [Niastella vici]|uniref:Peptidase M43 pregnancy-associated plasma-A domain-containing protein n=2 Tax=Niastella vici TaxID=1703345 RepID=A0A1V9FT57_9BACT|nr:hypothetical protein A3860_32045 [Niastella vici]